MNHLKDKNVKELEQYILSLLDQLEVANAYLSARKKLDALKIKEAQIKLHKRDGECKLNSAYSETRQYLKEQYGWEEGTFEFEIEEVESIVDDLCTGI